MNTFDKLAFFEVNQTHLNQSGFVISDKNSYKKDNTMPRSPSKKECYSNMSFNYTNTTKNSPI